MSDTEIVYMERPGKPKLWLGVPWALCAALLTWSFGKAWVQEHELPLDAMIVLTPLLRRRLDPRAGLAEQAPLQHHHSDVPDATRGPSHDSRRRHHAPPAGHKPGASPAGPGYDIREPADSQALPAPVGP
ncbi:hypothetical protein GCM10010116_61870 [Microbispora rosea subsp. aerata]|nr:hypothetical protein GCM10010116_61870 [Microbispora rosea subsp. aerata]GLJ86702.1 hypothetical protein GCM10017588_54410 [Microbispora rosea subsp. aerata]